MRSLLFLALALSLALTGCGESRAQLAELSQCREDLIATVLAHRTGAQSDHVGILMGAAMDRLDAYVLGTEISLPPPKVRATDLAASPDVAAQEGRDAAQAKAHPPISPGFPWLATLLGVAGALIPGIVVAGTLLARLRAAMAALGVTVQAIEAAPVSAGKPIKEATKAAKNRVLNNFVKERT